MRISDWSSDVCSSDLTCRAGAVRALAIDAARGLEQPRVAKVGEGIQVGVGDRPDAAAVAAVPAVRPTERHVLEAREANAAVAALAAFDADTGFIHQLLRSRPYDRYKRHNQTNRSN